MIWNNGYIKRIEFSHLGHNWRASMTPADGFSGENMAWLSVEHELFDDDFCAGQNLVAAALSQATRLFRARGSGHVDQLGGQAWRLVQGGTND